MPDIKRHVATSLDATKHSFKLNKGCFDLFGYDFLIDADFNTYLIEVNTNPCLDEASPLLAKLVPRMINDALRLTIDQTFGPRKGMQPYDP